MRPVKILVVEDDVFLGESLVKRLEKAGYTVTGLAGNKHDAMDSFVANTPDLVIVDIELDQKGTNRKDKYGGIDLVNKLSESFNTPCIYYTGHGEDDAFIEKAEASSHTGILIKTAPFLQVKLTVQSVLNKFWEAEKKRKLPDFLYTDRVREIRGIERRVLHKVQVSDILWVEYKNNNIIIHVENSEEKFGKKNLSLSTFLDRYPYPFFLRISQSVILNMEKEIDIISDTDEVIITDNILSIGKAYRAAFFQYVNQHRLKSQ